MIEKKISREKFVELISKLLIGSNLGFVQNGECWTLEQKRSGGTATVAVNGQPVTVRQEDQLVQFRVEVLGQGDVHEVGASEPGDEFLQILFSIRLNGQAVREIEDCIYIQNDVTQFSNTFLEIFG